MRVIFLFGGFFSFFCIDIVLKNISGVGCILEHLWFIAHQRLLSRISSSWLSVLLWAEEWESLAVPSVPER